MINFSNTYSKLPSSFYERSNPSAAKSPSLIAYNYELGKALGIDTQRKTNEELANIFSGKVVLNGSEPLGMAYCGHQFGHFNPSLGDGRAHLLGEVLTGDNQRYDIQLKGSGRTKFSRGGDGLSWLGPVVREYIVSEAMHHLGIPTTRALCAVRSGAPVFREDELPGGIFTRVASSHLRVGTFEYFSARSEQDLKTLADYAIERHNPELSKEAHKYYRFFESVVKRKLSLVSKWMGVGFIHGVMNTDNTSIAGITIDYGPCGFMDNYKHDKVFSSIDRFGRYSYSNQAKIALWNMSVLANALFPLLLEESGLSSDQLADKLQKDFKEFEEYYNDLYLRVMCRKFGIFNPKKEDSKIVNLFLSYLEDNHLDFTNSFRALNQLQHENKEFEKLWLARIEDQDKGKEQIVELINSSNPYIIPRNHQVARAIDSCLEGNDEYFLNLVEAYKNPFTQNDSLEDLAKGPTSSEIVHQTFCGT